jgi:hypothetical protein
MPYIDIKHLFKCETCRHLKYDGCNTFCDCGEMYSPDITKIPTADVAEVVRCKDCKYRHVPCRCALWCGSLDEKEYFIERGEDFYCSYGERKDT